MAKQNSVIIDPGHGGSDPGAVYGNRREKDDTLALSYDIGNALAITRKDLFTPC